jgi:hypothetical protein
MTSLRSAFGLALALTTLVPLSAIAQSVKAADIKAATTGAELVAMGATKLSAAQFKEYVVDKTLDEGTWTWTIKSDGTNSAVSDDKSWSDGPSPWWMKGNRYCIKGKDGKDSCRDVYMIGSYLRFGSDKDIGKWTVKIK